MTRPRLLVLAPTRRAATETFVRANLAGLPFAITAYFGDERPWRQPDRFVYGLAVLCSKFLTRLGLLKIASWPAALVAFVLIRRHQPNVVMVEFGFHAVRVMESCDWADVPLVVHFRGSDASARDRLGLLQERYRRLMTIASGVIVKSLPMAKTLLALGAKPERLLISPSGANTELFYGSAPGLAPPVLLAVGRFVAKKGPLQTIRAFSQLCSRFSTGEVQPLLWMVGDGPLFKSAQELVQDLALQEQVSFLGVRSQREVAALMRQVRLFVQHSMVAPDGDSEGNPVAVMEAQLSGLPVVATRHAGIPEVVLDGESGLLVEEGDERGMTEAMEHFIKNPQLAARMGECGRNRVQNSFTVNHHLDQLSRFLFCVASLNNETDQVHR